MKIAGYRIGLAGPGDVLLPERRRFLSAQGIDGEVRAWFLVDPSSRVVSVRFVVFNTGAEVDDELALFLDHMATIQLHGSVWHLFEMKEASG